MKIFGLIDLRSLFIFDNYSDNFENSINAAYKMCEDGVSGLAIIGNFKDALKIYNFLKDKVDIPVTIVVKTERQRKVATKYLMSPIFSKKLLSHSVKTVFPDNANFLKKKMGDAVVFLNNSLLKIFHEEDDYIPEIIAVASYRMAEIGYEYIITSEPLSVRAGLKLFFKSQ
ncbi:MAG: hypothetical protein J7J57_03170 [Caldisericaceae bacterium]|nr:hypothetical protein [Caldisericaceae bacterium]